MALFPLSSNFEGDFVVQLVVVDDGATMDEVASACAVHSIDRRVAPRPGKVLRIRRHSTGELYPREMLVKNTGLMPTETIDVIFSDI
ncbi:toluene-4-monooxygenase system B family protein [Zavarzinia compransoris]|uniref:toluene-4-monooxygenase system B family protein n=1 Tax=Zavarzinia marina TaxID=2911065 RepID=UPI001F1A495C|nr:toluene-4-monooxygenase system B family protein [Zavarzinia marina]MCF4167012.1 toluene-4-monooxygenase system B family protein [Zavarzinia marina]